MLRDLSVRNLAVVAEATLEFAPGLNVLTGETGAGKSIVVDALALLSGVRASSDLIRTGCDRLVVTGRFEPASRDWRRRLAAVGVSTDEEDVVVRREVSREGRNRVFLNDTPVTLKLLSELAPEFVRIHTQREELGLLRPGLQREWLDQSGGVAAQKILAKVAALYREYRRLAERLEEVTGDDRLRTERVDLLRFQTGEISEAQVTAGEEEALRSERDTLRNADAIRTALDAAYSSLFEGEGAVVEAVSHSERDLSALEEWIPEARGWIAELAEARVRVEEVARTLGSRLATVDANPARLDEIESRLVVLERLCRKYGGSTVQVLEEAERMLEELERLEVDTEQRGELDALVQSALDRYSQGAEKLSQAREQWGRSLAQALHSELAELALKNTEFAARLGRVRRMGSPLRPQGEGIEFGETGFDRVEFLFAPNPGEALAPLAKAASGGELARLYLALQLAVGAGLAPRPTVVFDEVDAGVGGAEAAAVGRKLKRLSETGQTIVVTHLPQVASFGDRLLECIERGGVLAIPTEASYGLAVDPSNQEAVASVFQIKGRPAGMPLPVVVGDLSALAGLGVEVAPRMRDRLRQMWPAPLTVVLPIRQPSAASVGLSTLAVRIPQHDQLRELLIKLGRGLTATSANRSGEPAMLGPAEVGHLLDGVDALVVDGGVLPGGPPSTLVAPEKDGWKVLRQGAFPAERLL